MADVTPGDPLTFGCRDRVLIGDAFGTAFMPALSFRITPPSPPHHPPITLPITPPITAFMPGLSSESRLHACRFPTHISVTDRRNVELQYVPLRAVTYG